MTFEALFAGHARRARWSRVQIGNSERWPALLLALLRRRPGGAAARAAHGEWRARRSRSRPARPLRWSRSMDDELRAHPLRAADHARLRLGRSRRRIFSSSPPARPACRARFAFARRSSSPIATQICATMGITERDLNFGVIPFSHSYGFSNLVTPLLCRGVPLVASEDRMPRAILDDLARSGATVFPGHAGVLSEARRAAKPPGAARAAALHFRRRAAAARGRASDSRQRSA